MTDRAPNRRLLPRSAWSEVRVVAAILRTETAGGILLLAAAVIALAWANSPWAVSYTSLESWVPWPGGKALHLDLTLTEWAGDGLLAIFFFVVGLELKREFVAGDLRDPRRATLPIVAALGGMVLPAAIYTAVTLSADSTAARGWAIPTATDIAFALAILAVINSHLPHGLRAFLLTLAVVDDLFAITIIAVFYTANLSWAPLLGALALIGVFALLVRRARTPGWLLVPIAVPAWALMHASGVHATVAGVLLGFAVPVLARGDRPARAERYEHRWRPVSAGFAVPVFALFAAGVPLAGVDAGLLTEPVFLGVVAGLLLGKSLGIFGSTWLLARFTRAELDSGISWIDLFGVALLGGIGFTVSLLIGELAFDAGSGRDIQVRSAVLAGSLVSALLAAVVLVRRNAVHRRLRAQETRDADGDGIPDCYQEPSQR
jgi:NhaA family Na+:H+ antiporter